MASRPEGQPISVEKPGTQFARDLERAFELDYPQENESEKVTVFKEPATINLALELTNLPESLRDEFNYNQEPVTLETMTIRLEELRAMNASLNVARSINERLREEQREHMDEIIQKEVRVQKEAMETFQTFQDQMEDLDDAEQQPDLIETSRLMTEKLCQLTEVRILSVLETIRENILNDYNDNLATRSNNIMRSISTCNDAILVLEKISSEPLVLEPAATNETISTLSPLADLPEPQNTGHLDLEEHETGNE